MQGKKTKNDHDMSKQVLKGLGAELSCPVCGTVFLRSSADWAYRIATAPRSHKREAAVYFCSYTCMRTAQKEREVKKR